ncbi:MAG: sugar-transfer associated ATP-grasp domain-containing protein [Anaerolineaceae bacterium]
MFKTIASKRPLLDQARLVRDMTGKSIRAQVAEILALRLGYGRLYASEYYDFRLYDDREFPGVKKREFLGSRLEAKISESVNCITWDMIEEDKLMAYAVLGGLSLPIPRMNAIYHRKGRRYCALPTLRSPSELAEYLRNDATYPFFGKPVRGCFGRGGFAVSGLDRAADRLTFSNGDSASVNEFVAGLERLEGLDSAEFAQHGYILQEYLAPHPVIQEACGNISSIRLLVLLHDEGPKVFRAVWKVPRRGNMTDNFHRGISGNMLGWISASTGSVEHVVRGVGPRQERVVTHPDTGHRLPGLRLPDWDALVNVGLIAAASLPRLPFLHFDIAMTDRGPVVLEVNVLGSLDLVQLPAPSGLYDEELRSFLARHALDPKARLEHERANRWFSAAAASERR